MECLYAARSLCDSAVRFGVLRAVWPLWGRPSVWIGESIVAHSKPTIPTNMIHENMIMFSRYALSYAGSDRGFVVSHYGESKVQIRAAINRCCAGVRPMTPGATSPPL